MLVRARRARKPRVIRFRVVLVRGSDLCAFGPAWFGSTLDRAGVPTTRRVGRTRDLIAPPLEVFRRGLRHAACTEPSLVSRFCVVACEPRPAASRADRSLESGDCLNAARMCALGRSGERRILVEVCAHQISPRSDPKFLEHLAEVVLDRLRAQEQLRRHLTVRRACGYKPGDL